jgi:hypothetical protein
MKAFFEASDFEGGTIYDGLPTREYSELAAELSNLKLEREGLRLYSWDEAENFEKPGFGWHIDTIGRSRRTALLINIEEIKPKVCEHVPYFVHTAYHFQPDTIHYTCKKCNQILKAKWELAE